MSELMAHYDLLFTYTIVFVLGAVIGSFLNVCIYRIPVGLSVVFPASHCGSCSSPLKCYHNIPIISFLALRGKCAFCKQKISWRYPLIEALNGVLYVLVFNCFGLTTPTIVFFLFSSALVTITFIDFDHQIIPDVISIPGIFIGFSCSFFLPWLSWQSSLFGILLGGGSLFAVAAGYELLTKKQGMGGGDIKLLAMIGAFLGWKAVLPVIFFSSLAGTIIGVPLMLLKGENSRFAIPFGPFLALASITYLFWGGTIIRWYLGFFY